VVHEEDKFQLLKKNYINTYLSNILYNLCFSYLSALVVLLINIPLSLSVDYHSHLNKNKKLAVI
jgi:hypothetical protein